MQTLSESGFDRGRILAQTEGEGIEIPQGESVAGLRDLLAPVGAQMLVDVLRKGLHDPKMRQGHVLEAEEGKEDDGKTQGKIRGNGQSATSSSPRKQEGLAMEQESSKREGFHARKLTPADRELFLSIWSRQEGEEEWKGVLTGRRTQVLGDRAWANVVKPDGSMTRLLFHGVEQVEETHWTPELRNHIDCIQRCADARPETITSTRRASVVTEDYRKIMPPEMGEQKAIMWAGASLARHLDANHISRGEKSGLCDEAAKDALQRHSLVLPYFPDPQDASGGGILVPVDATKRDVVRIRGITVGGERARPAEAVLRRYSFVLGETEESDTLRLWESRRRKYLEGKR